MIRVYAEAERFLDTLYAHHIRNNYKKYSLPDSLERSRRDAPKQAGNAVSFENLLPITCHCLWLDTHTYISLRNDPHRLDRCVPAAAQAA
jgi:hypothetical protein